jgi:hypothetical protein
MDDSTADARLLPAFEGRSTAFPDSTTKCKACIRNAEADGFSSTRPCKACVAMSALEAPMETKKMTLAQLTFIVAVNDGVNHHAADQHG